MPEAISCRGLTKRYGDVLALHGLDLQVPCGSLLGFLGPNGPWKTTVMRLLLGQGRPPAGRPRCSGSTWPPVAWRCAAGSATCVLLILNQPAYGADETLNAIRLANALARLEGTQVTVFLMGDALTFAIAGQKTSDGYYTLDRMLRTFARHGATSPTAAPAWTRVDTPRSASSPRHPDPTWRS